MKSFKILCAATLLTASFGANAEIQPVNNAALSSVSGQLKLKNITGNIKNAGKNTAGNLKHYSKNAAGNVKLHVKDHVSDVKRNLGFAKIVLLDHPKDFLTVEASFKDRVLDSKSDIKRNIGFASIILVDHIDDIFSFHTVRSR